MITYKVVLTTTQTTLEALLTTAGYTNYTQNFTGNDGTIHTTTADLLLSGVNDTATVIIPLKQILPVILTSLLRSKFSSATAGTELFIIIN